MDNQEYWERYVPDVRPAEFMARFSTRDARECVDEFLAGEGRLYGVVRQGTWRETFAAEHQAHRDEVAAYLSEHLVSTRDEWEPELEALRSQPTEEATPTPQEDVQAATPTEMPEDNLTPEAESIEDTAAPVVEAAPTETVEDTPAPVAEVSPTETVGDTPAPAADEVVAAAAAENR